MDNMANKKIWQQLSVILVGVYSALICLKFCSIFNKSINFWIHLIIGVLAPHSIHTDPDSAQNLNAYPDPGCQSCGSRSKTLLMIFIFPFWYRRFCSMAPILMNFQIYRKKSPQRIFWWPLLSKASTYCLYSAGILWRRHVALDSVQYGYSTPGFAHCVRSGRAGGWSGDLTPRQRSVPVIRCIVAEFFSVMMKRKLHQNYAKICITTFYYLSLSYSKSMISSVAMHQRVVGGEDERGRGLNWFLSELIKVEITKQMTLSVVVSSISFFNHIRYTYSTGTYTKVSWS